MRQKETRSGMNFSKKNLLGTSKFCRHLLFSFEQLPDSVIIWKKATKWLNKKNKKWIEKSKPFCLNSEIKKLISEVICWKSSKFTYLFTILLYLPAVITVSVDYRSAIHRLRAQHDRLSQEISDEKQIEKLICDRLDKEE